VAAVVDEHIGVVGSRVIGGHQQAGGDVLAAAQVFGEPAHGQQGLSPEEAG